MKNFIFKDGDRVLVYSVKFISRQLHLMDEVLLNFSL